MPFLLCQVLPQCTSIIIRKYKYAREITGGGSEFLIMCLDLFQIERDCFWAFFALECTYKTAFYIGEGFDGRD